MPQGKALSDEIPAEIRKDFNEARLVVNYSVRCANALLRICTETICHFIAEKFLDEEDKNKIIAVKILNNKISMLKSKVSNIRLNCKIFDMLTCLREYGNDNCHSIRKIEDSDSQESYDNLCSFIHSICENIISVIEDNKKIDEMKQKIHNKN